MSDQLNNDEQEDFHVLFMAILDDDVEKQILLDVIDGLEPQEIYNNIINSLRGARHD